MSLNIELLSSLSDKHPKPQEVTFQYGTAGFRTLCVLRRASRARDR